jgi:hypothetical protein
MSAAQPPRQSPSNERNADGTILQVIPVPQHGGPLRFSITSAATGKMSLQFEVRLTHFDWALLLTRWA